MNKNLPCVKPCFILIIAWLKMSCFQIPFLRKLKQTRSVQQLFIPSVHTNVCSGEKITLQFLSSIVLVYFISPFQVIVEKAPKARIGDLDKKKYLVPSDLTGNRNRPVLQLNVKCLWTVLQQHCYLIVAFNISHTLSYSL